jgi:hypothetical protein
MKLPLLALTLILPALAQDPTAEQIMARVAQNQAHSQELRKSYVYNQKVLVRFTRSNGKLAREEKLDYTVAPSAGGVERKLSHFEGKYVHHAETISFNDPEKQFGNIDLDGDLARSMVSDMTEDKQSKDGIAHDMFPLVASEQVKYIFKLEGKQNYRGRTVYRVTFRPKPHTDDADWKGEALIDAEECQPVAVSTSLAWHIPMAVKILLGTDIKGLGFSVSYQKFGDGVWFPVSYGGEFHVRAAFFYARNMSISLANSDFTHANVSTKIAYDTSGK